MSLDSFMEQTYLCAVGTFRPQYSRTLNPARFGTRVSEVQMATNNLKPRLVRKNEDNKAMATVTEKFEHWSGEEVSFDYNERSEPFSGIEDAYNALADQAASREEKDKDGNVKDGKDRNSLVLAEMLAIYNGYIRWAARKVAVDAQMAKLGITDDSEALFKSLVSTIRAKLDAKGESKDNLRIARQKALEKVKSLNLDE